jgi:hypothetical protein
LYYSVTANLLYDWNRDLFHALPIEPILFGGILHRWTGQFAKRFALAFALAVTQVHYV